VKLAIRMPETPDLTWRAFLDSKYDNSIVKILEISKDLEVKSSFGMVVV